MTLDFLNRRLSVPSRQLGAPGPSDAELNDLLAAAIRVPDHGRLAPWRLLLIRGEARARLGATLAEIHRRNEPDAPDAAIEKDRQRFGYAPVVVAVVARIDEQHAKIPAQEQLLSAGCVAYNLLLGAEALGYGAQWLTGWSAYDREAAAVLGLAANERVIGYVHIGTPRERPAEHARPALESVVSEWSPAA